MTDKKHPLVDNNEWVFKQPYIGIQTAIAIDKPGKGMEVVPICSRDSCRETLISNIRTWMKGLATEKYTHKRAARIVLEHPEVLGDGKTKLMLYRAGAQNMPKNTETGAPIISDPEMLAFSEQFPHAMNALVGIPALLLNPNRRRGDWWKTEHDELWCNKNEGAGTPHWYIMWNGLDNSLLYHPALTAVILGLFRQAELLREAGEWKNIFAAIDREEIEQVLTENNRKGAEKIVQKLRPWIHVPVGKNGSFNNYPFPWYARTRGQVSYWQRFIRLYRSLERFGFEKVMGGDLFEAWGLEEKSPYHSGAFSFWGYGQAQQDDNYTGELTEAHRRVMEMGAGVQDGEE